MPIIQVRNVPDHIYKRIVQLAEQERRSIAQETLSLIESALGMDSKYKLERKKLVDSILMENKGAYNSNVPDPVPMIREDRER